jgi:hypothetical protein
MSTVGRVARPARDGHVPPKNRSGDRFADLAVRPTVSQQLRLGFRRACATNSASGSEYSFPDSQLGNEYSEPLAKIAASEIGEGGAGPCIGPEVA